MSLSHPCLTGSAAAAAVADVGDCQLVAVSTAVQRNVHPSHTAAL